MRITVQTRGVEGVQEFLRSRAVNLTGGPRKVEIVARGQRNTTIATVQAAQDRNPFFRTPAEARRIVEILRYGLSEALADNHDIGPALHGAGEQLVEDARAHIDGRRSGGVPPTGITGGHQTRPLTRAYAARKARTFGAGLPELVATGEFWGSLYHRVTR